MAPKKDKSGKKSKKDKKGKGKKGKNKKGKHKKGKESTPTLPPITHFDPPVAYNTEQVATSITLLSSPEDHVIMQALAVLVKKAYDREEEFINYLVGMEAQKKLIPLIYHENVVILRMALKLLAQIMRLPQTLKDMTLKCLYSFTNQVLCLFTEHSDLLVKQFVTIVLSMCVRQHQMIVNLVYTDEFLKKVFDALLTIKIPDVQLNLLELLFYSLEATNAAHIAGESPNFLHTVLICFVKSEVIRIQDMALKVIDKIMALDDKKIYTRYKDIKFYEFLFESILDDNLDHIRKRLLDIIIHVTSYKEPVDYMVKTPDFLAFCYWGITCPGKYLEPAAVILKKITSHPQNLQLLYDLSVEETVMSLFRTNNEKVFYNATLAIDNMSSHHYCMEKIANPVLIDRIMKMLSQNNIPVVPYHEQAIKIVYKFICKSELAYRFLPTCKYFNKIFTLLDSEEKIMTRDGYGTILKIIHLYSMRDSFKYKIMDREVYRTIFHLFESSEFTMIALKILNQYVSNSEYRLLFLELNGPSIVVDKLRTTYCNDLFMTILLFLEGIVIYKKMSNAFIKDKLIPILRSVIKHNIRQTPAINRVLTLLYDLNLPLKFFELGRLGIEDKISDRFYLIKGPWKGDFPILELLEHTKVCPYPTIYLVDLKSAYSEEDLKDVFQNLKTSAKNFETTYNDSQKAFATVTSIDTFPVSSTDAHLSDNKIGPQEIKRHTKENFERKIIRYGSDERSTFVNSEFVTNGKFSHLNSVDDVDLQEVFSVKDTRPEEEKRNSEDVQPRTVGFSVQEESLTGIKKPSGMSIDLRFNPSAKQNPGKLVAREGSYDLITVISSKLNSNKKTTVLKDLIDTPRTFGIRYSNPDIAKIKETEGLRGKEKVMAIIRSLYLTPISNPTGHISGSKTSEELTNDYDDDYTEPVVLEDVQTEKERKRPIVHKPLLHSVVNYGGITPDTCLPIMVEELKVFIYYNKAIKFTDKVLILAKFVYEQLAGPYETDTELQHVFDVHLQSLKTLLGNNVVPIGLLRRGGQCERALLFKTLGDQLDLPSTLIKDRNSYWNEVPVLISEIHEDPEVGMEKVVNYYVVDLMDDIGKLMLVSSREAMMYCYPNKKVGKFRDIPEISTSVSNTKVRYKNKNLASLF